MEKQDILDSQSQRTKGVDALNSNIEATKALSSIIKTTLGPQGMDKMLIDSTGESIITNDGVKILQEMDIEHPGAQLLVEVARTQEQEIGDGTTSAVILAGELLTQAQELLNQGIHPSFISKVFKETSLECLSILESLATPLEKEEMIKTIATTAMTGKLAESSKEYLSGLLYELISEVKNSSVDKKLISIVKATGESINESSLLKGVILDKMRAHSNMPDKIKNPTILLTDMALEIQELENQANISIQNAKEYEEFLAAEQQYLEQLAETIIQSGASVVVSQKGIDDSLAYFLAKKGIIAIRRCKKSDVEKLSKSLNTPIVSSLQDISSSVCGNCGEVRCETINDEEYIFFEKCPNPKAFSLLLKSSTKQTVDELERAIHDAIGVVTTIVNSRKIVAGGGAIELELYKNLMEYTKTLPGKKQRIAQHYAKSLLAIPNTLCSNAGLEIIDTISTLHLNHEKGFAKSGINDDAISENTLNDAIIEPLMLKKQALSSATETAMMILRIDDIIAAKKLTNQDIE